MVVHGIKLTAISLCITFACFLMATMAVYGQRISNMSVLRTDPTDQNNTFTTDAIQLTETEDHTYLGLQFGNSPMYFNDELITEGGHPFADNKYNYYYLLQLDAANKYENYTSIYLKGISKNISWNTGNFDRKVGFTTKDDLIYLYGAIIRTDSLFVKDRFVTMIPGGGAFVLTFNESLDVIDEFFFGLDSLATLNDVTLRVDQQGDYHLNGRFRSRDTSYRLPIGDQSLAIVDNIVSDDNSTHFYAKVHHDTKLVAFASVYGGGFTDWQNIAGFVVDEDENACILFNQFGNAEFNGVLVPDEQYLYDVSQFCINGDSMIYYIHYEGPGLQDAVALYSFESGTNYEIITTTGGEYPFITGLDTLFFDYLTNKLIVKRDETGELQWMQNIYGPQGAINIEDMSYSPRTQSLWLSGNLRKDSTFYIDGVPLRQDYFGEGFLMELDEPTGLFRRVFWPKIETDIDSHPYTNILQIGQATEESFKVVSRVGFRDNTEQETYDYTIGSLTTPVSGRGEVYIFDLDPDGITATAEQMPPQAHSYPNPIRAGQVFRSADTVNDYYNIYNTSGQLVALIENDETFPMLRDGIYILKGNQNGRTTKVLVLPIN